MGIANPLGARKNGCIGAGDAGFFCKYVTDYLAEAGIPMEQILRGGYTIKTTLDRNAMEKMKASLNAEVPADAANVADVMAIVAPGQDQHRVLAMGSTRTFGLDAGQAGDQLRAAVRAGQPGRRVGVQDLHHGHGLAEGPGHQLPDDGAAVGLRLPDLRRRQRPADPGEQRRATTPEKLSVTDALAQSPNTAFIKLEEFTGVPDVVDMAVRLGMKSLATTPFVDPNTGRRTDRSIAEVTKAQKQASFTLGVSPTSVLELANVGATLAVGREVVPAQPDRVGHRRRTASRCRSPRPRATRPWSPGWRTPCSPR